MYEDSESNKELMLKEMKKDKKTIREFREDEINRMFEDDILTPREKNIVREKYSKKLFLNKLKVSNYLSCISSTRIVHT